MPGEPRRQGGCGTSTEGFRTGYGKQARVAEEPRIAGVAFVYLGVIIMSWAGNWPLMKLALGQVPPLVFVLFRLIGSLALIAPALLVTRQPLLPVRGERMSLFWVGELQVAGFLICSIIGLAILPAGRAIVLAYTMPLWAIPIGLFLWPEPLDRTRPTGGGDRLLGWGWSPRVTSKPGSGSWSRAIRL